VAIKWEQVPK